MKDSDGEFRALVDAHAQDLFALACSMLGNRADAEDVVQETFLAAYRGLDRFEGRSSPRTWLTAILVRQVARRRRDAGRRPALRLADAAEDPRLAAPADARFLPDEARSAAEAVLSRLTPEQRDALLLRELHGLSYDEMAEALGIPRGTVESRLHRARDAVRRATAARDRAEGHAAG